jgi:hypothetical protein
VVVMASPAERVAVVASSAASFDLSDLMSSVQDSERGADTSR